jgi:hypothetical protein
MVCRADWALRMLAATTKAMVLPRMPKDCIANNNAELTQACYPEFQALLAPEDFTTLADVTAVWQKQPATEAA